MRRVRWRDGDVFFEPGGVARGEVVLPGSKSLTNRYLLCAALADGDSRLEGASPARDTQRMLAGLQALGIGAEVAEGALEVRGARGEIPVEDAELDVGDAGTAMRFLTAFCALGYGRFRVDGSARMRQRPIGALVGALQELGVGIGYDGDEGYPPVVMEARGLTGGEVRLPAVVSSQFVSALLMIAPYARRDVMLAVEDGVPSRPYVDMTLRVMRSMGVELVADEAATRFIVPASQRYAGGTYAIEPDASAATYFWAAAAITGGSVRVRGLTRDSAQGDVGFAALLERMGCAVDYGPDYIEVTGPPEGALQAVNEDLNAMPDTVQTLAVAALFADGVTQIRNVANLRVKETDRLTAVAAELARLGATVDVHRDGLTIFPPKEFQPAKIRTYDDHRMAMSMALTGLVVDGIVVCDAGCVVKSFPRFFEVLEGVLTAC